LSLSYYGILSQTDRRTWLRRTDGHGLIDSTSDPDQERLVIRIKNHILNGVENVSSLRCKLLTEIIYPLQGYQKSKL